MVPKAFLGQSLISNLFVLNLRKYFVGSFHSTRTLQVISIKCILVVDLIGCALNTLKFSYFSKAKS